MSSILNPTPTSVALSNDRKRRGWTFVGPTTNYALTQAMGRVSEHLEGCDVGRAAAARGPTLP